MAKVDIAVNHGQSPETAKANFERVIVAAQARYTSWIRVVDWSEDRRTARMVGTGFEVELSYDEEKVYARGSVPLAVKLLEGPIKAFIAQTVAQGS
jgi:hypothetical protein